LLSCLIGARLRSSVIKDLQLYDVNIFCWTDSTTALYWIQRDQNWGTFAQNRVREIYSLASPVVWRHIPGIFNIADAATRGCSVEQLLKQRWWEGPVWLHRRILPNDRVCESAIFEIVGVDLTGPLYLKSGKQAYIVLYTCAVYRAIHLELITLLTTETFFQSLRRFVARRRRPTTIYSDNGTNFRGERLLHELHWDKLLSKVSEQKIQKFSPPTTAWWGGWNA
ncbi:integrase catalytic domain-containing protein, partial [Trichonephila clavipes]